MVTTPAATPRPTPAEIPAAPLLDPSGMPDLATVIVTHAAADGQITATRVHAAFPSSSAETNSVAGTPDQLVPTGFAMYYRANGDRPAIDAAATMLGTALGTLSRTGLTSVPDVAAAMSHLTPDTVYVGFASPPTGAPITYSAPLGANPQVTAVAERAEQLAAALRENQSAAHSPRR